MTWMLAVAIRWVHILGASLLVGVFLFLTAVARPAVAGGGPDAVARLMPLERRLRRLARWSLVATLLAGGLDLWRQAGVATGLDLLATLRPTILWSVLSGTRYGTVWLLRHGLLGALGVGVLARRAPDLVADRQARELEGLVLAGASLMVGAVAGHAASARVAPDTAMAADAFHLLATGGWLGALLPFALFLRWARALPEALGCPVAACATMRFSTIGLVGVTVLTVTGIYAAWEHVASGAALVGTAYGRWLLAKLALFALLLVVAGLNRFRLTPQIQGAERPSRRHVRRPVRQLFRHVVGEVALGGAVLVAVAVLGITTPARHAAPIWPFSFRLSWAATKDLPGVPARLVLGAAVAFLGFAALVLALVRRPRRAAVAAAAGGLAAGLGVTVALRPLAVDAYPTTYLQPAIPYTASSIDRGALLYGTHCAVCHGIGGYGDGPAAATLRPPPADLTARHTADHTVGDLFWWVTHGIRGSAMPAFADRLSPEQRWDVLNFVRALSAAEAARRLGPVLDPDPSIVAPDFAYTTGAGDSRSLKDARNDSAVLLVFFSLPGSADRLGQLSRLAGAFRRVGVGILGVPLDVPSAATAGASEGRWGFPVVLDGAPEARVTYGLFRRDLSAAGFEPDPPWPRHMELLVDRQGYLRARWIADRGAGWGDPSRLIAEVERLATEVPKAPPPDEHVH